MIRRRLNILKSNSFFLFGARGVGKSYLINEFLKEAKVENSNFLCVDLLEPDVFDKYVRNPSALMQELSATNKNFEWVVIDEVQKIPQLLDVVHKLIETTKIKFALTGSSARKLKRGGANLLAGRAYTYSLFPLTSNEIGSEFNLNQALTWGTLPKSYLSNNDQERMHYLRSYAYTYLKEEIQVEQIVRKIDPFRKFLNIAAQMNGKIINFSSIARDVGVSDVTVQTYFQILEDTLIGFMLEPYHTSIRKRQRESPKFYFFDTGVQRSLADQLTLPLIESTYLFGNTFEHFIILELKRRSEYLMNDYKFSYLCTKDNAEIDLIIERPGKPIALIEIKSSTEIKEEHVSQLNKFKIDFPNSEAFCLSRDKSGKRIGSISCLYWLEGINLI